MWCHYIYVLLHYYTLSTSSGVNILTSYSNCSLTSGKGCLGGINFGRRGRAANCLQDQVGMVSWVQDDGIGTADPCRTYMDCILSTRKKDFGWSSVSFLCLRFIIILYRSIFVDPSTYWRLGIEGRRCPYGGGCDAGFAMGFCRERGGIFSPATNRQTEKSFYVYIIRVSK